MEEKEEEKSETNKFEIDVLSESEISNSKMDLPSSNNNIPNANEFRPISLESPNESKSLEPEKSGKQFMNLPKRNSREIKLSVLKEKNVLLSVFMYSIIGFYYTMLDETLPLFAMADVSSGGLAFSLDNIGFTNAITGSFVILMQMFVYHNVVGRLKLINTFRLGSILAIPMIIAYPCLSFFNPFGRIAIWSAVVILCAIRAFVSQCQFSSVMALINNSTDYNNMGSVNGFGQSLVALLRATGPAFSASVLAWSFENKLGFPFNHYFVFLLASILGIAPIVMTFYLSKSMNKPKNEVEEIEMTIDI